MKYLLYYRLFIILSIWSIISCDQKPDVENVMKTEDTKKIIDYKIYNENLEKYPPMFLPNLHLKNNLNELEKTQNLYNEYLINNDILSKEEFLKNALQFQNSIMNDNIELTENYPPKKILEDQILLMVIMFQAFALTDDSQFLNSGHNLLNIIFSDQKDGGFRSDWNQGTFFEVNQTTQDHVLHSHLLALLSLDYILSISEDSKTKNLFDNGLKTICFKLREYDSYFTSLYSKGKGNDYQYIFASAIGQDPDYYHELAILQLLTLYLKTNEPILKEFAHQFFKQDMGSFSYINNKSKFFKLNASYSIDSDKLNVKYLDDELWSWGKYWSTSKFPTSLNILFHNEVKNIEAISFYSIKENSSPKDFNVFVKNKNDWKFICNSNQILMRNQNYYKTNHYETFISTYYLPFTVNGTEIKIEFLDSHSSRIIALREINIFYDRDPELTQVLEKLKVELGIK